MFSVGHERKTVLSNALFKGFNLLAKGNLGGNFEDTTPGLRKAKKIADIVDEQFNAKAIEVLNTMSPESDEFKSAVRKFYRCNMDKDNGDSPDNIGSQTSLKNRPKEVRATVLWKRAKSMLKKKQAFVPSDERWLIGGRGLNGSSEDKSTPSHSSKNSRPPKSQGQASPLPSGDAKGVSKTGNGYRRMPQLVIHEEHSMSEPDEGMHQTPLTDMNLLSLAVAGAGKRFGNNEDKLKSFLKQKTGNLLAGPGNEDLPIDAGDFNFLRASLDNARELRFSERLEKIKADEAFRIYGDSPNMFDSGNYGHKKIVYKSLDNIDDSETPHQTFEDFVEIEAKKDKIGYKKTYNIRTLSVDNTTNYTPTSCNDLKLDEMPYKIRSSGPGHI
jgi:hypothetical protein